MLEVLARTKARDDIIHALTQQGVPVKTTRTGILVTLLPIDPDNQEEYWIPEELEEPIFLLHAAEEGGGQRRTGRSTIVCGLSGKALKPYYIRAGSAKICGEHAYFTVPNGLVTVSGYRQDRSVAIREHTILIHKGIAKINTSILWDGERQAIPRSLSDFWDAAQAAEDKCQCQSCRDVHYASFPV
jgi:hypothetical protein